MNQFPDGAEGFYAMRCTLAMARIYFVSVVVQYFSHAVIIGRRCSSRSVRWYAASTLFETECAKALSAKSRA